MITLSQPERSNALRRELYPKLVAAYRRLEADEAVAAVTNGVRSCLCAGRDVKEAEWFAERAPDDVKPRLVEVYCEREPVTPITGTVVGGPLILPFWFCDVVISGAGVEFELKDAHDEATDVNEGDLSFLGHRPSVYEGAQS